jgi:hypothetical protein
MKTKEIIALVSVALGIGAGFGLYWLVPEAHWAVYVIAGAIVTGAAGRAFRDEAVQDCLLDQLDDKKT